MSTNIVRDIKDLFSHFLQKSFGWSKIWNKGLQQLWAAKKDRHISNQLRDFQFRNGMIHFHMILRWIPSRKATKPRLVLVSNCKIFRNILSPWNFASSGRVASGLCWDQIPMCKVEEPLIGQLSYKKCQCLSLKVLTIRTKLWCCLVVAEKQFVRKA